MNTSQAGINLIKVFESLRLKAYKDSAGIFTIGYGTIQYPNGSPVKEKEVIDMERAEKLLKYEVIKKEGKVRELTAGVNLNQNQFDALVSFAYNCGTHALETSTLLKKVKANPSDPSIKDEFLKWNKITLNGKKVPLKGLTNRREREYQLYSTPM